MEKSPLYVFVLFWSFHRESSLALLYPTEYVILLLSSYREPFDIERFENVASLKFEKFTLRGEILSTDLGSRGNDLWYFSAYSRNEVARRDEKLCEREPKPESLPLDLCGRREDISSPSKLLLRGLNQR